MAELADAHDSNSCGATRVGSSPTFGTQFSTTVCYNLWQTVVVRSPIVGKAERLLRFPTDYSKELNCWKKHSGTRNPLRPQPDRVSDSSVRLRAVTDL